MVTNNSNQEVRLADFPALAALRIDDGDLSALSQQGFLWPERRKETTYFRLRFRQGLRQITRYVGDEIRARLVQEELDRLQAKARTWRKLSAMAQESRQLLRRSKRILEPFLAERQFHFHGLAIRKTRAAKPNTKGG